MRRFLFSAFTIFAILISGDLSRSEVNGLENSSRSSYILPLEFTSQAGLVQSWFNQVTLDTAVDKVESLILVDKQIFVTTDSSKIEAINGETGATMWTRRVGETKYKTYQPAANSRVVVVLNGTILYIYDRYNGKKLLEVPLYGQPSSGPLISERFVYIPLLSRKLFVVPLSSYKLPQSNLAESLNRMDEVRKTVKFSDDIEERIKSLQKTGEQTQYLIKAVEDSEFCFCPMFGSTMVPPTLATQDPMNEYVCWTTDQGWLLIGKSKADIYQNRLEILYKVSILPEALYLNSKRFIKMELAEDKGVQARPHFIANDISFLNMRNPKEDQKGGLVLVGTDMGYVLAVNDQSGEVRWKFPAGAAITEKIVSHENFCYLCTAEDKLFCVNIVDGLQSWMTEDIVKVLSVSEKVIYAENSRGFLVVLNKVNGQKLKIMALPKYKFKLINDESDRIYMATEDGLIQCLREVSRPVPFVRIKTTGEASKELFAKIAEKKGQEVEKIPGEQKEIVVPAPVAEVPAAQPAGEEPVAKPAEKKPASSPDDIFGEATGAKPKEEKKPAQKAEDQADPFSNIFD